MAKTKGPLTEAELLKMPEKDYMNAAQLAFFKARLEAMRDEILEKAAETVEHMREIEAVADPADRATVEEEHTLELRTRDRERKLLRKIEKSLQRMAEDEYGYCEGCGIEIGLRRLEARPTAELCIECKQVEEIKEKSRAA